MKKINEIIAYQNKDIIDRYNKDYPNNKISAEEALVGVIQYLWLSQQHQIDKKNQPNNNELNFVCGVYPEMQEIDDMWHTFILFTKEYAEFCQKYFGEFMHHAPNTHVEKTDLKNFEIEFTRYLNYIYGRLGEETVKRWFSDLMA